MSNQGPEVDSKGSWLLPFFLSYISFSFQFASSALTLLIGRQEECPACSKNWVMECWCCYLSEARCRLFTYGAADATASQNPIVPWVISIQTGFTFLVRVQYSNTSIFVLYQWFLTFLDSIPQIKLLSAPKRLTIISYRNCGQLKKTLVLSK